MFTMSFRDSITTMLGCDADMIECSTRFLEHDYDTLLHESCERMSGEERSCRPLTQKKPPGRTRAVADIAFRSGFLCRAGVGAILILALDTLREGEDQHQIDVVHRN